jgi:hypothetical protein
MFRDNSVEMLGSSVEQVLYLGHKSVKITEKHHAPGSRRDKNS